MNDEKKKLRGLGISPAVFLCELSFCRKKESEIDMSWSQASTTTGFYSGMNYSVSELGSFAGQVLSEGTGRAAIGRQKDEEAKKKAEAEAAKNKSGQNVPPSSAAEGFVNALGAGLIRKILIDRLNRLALCQ